MQTVDSASFKTNPLRVLLAMFALSTSDGAIASYPLELGWLRRENRVLKQEKEVLQKTAA